RSAGLTNARVLAAGGDADRACIEARARQRSGLRAVAPARIARRVVERARAGRLAESVLPGPHALCVAGAVKRSGVDAPREGSDQREPDHHHAPWSASPAPPG